MRITREIRCPAVSFEGVDQGSIISYDGSLYMKIPEVTYAGHLVNAINLETGAVRTISSNTLILLVEDYEFKYML